MVFAGLLGVKNRIKRAYAILISHQFFRNGIKTVSRNSIKKDRLRKTERKPQPAARNESPYHLRAIIY